MPDPVRATAHAEAPPTAHAEAPASPSGEPHSPADEPLTSMVVHSVRSPRAWMIAAAQSLTTAGLGFFLLVMSFGAVLEEFNEQPPSGVVAIHAGDLLLGLALAVLIGPLRFLAHTRIGTVLHLLAATIAGLSLTGLPAGLVALHRLGRARRLPVDLLAIGLLIAATLGVMLLDASVRGTSPNAFWTISVVVASAVGITALALGRLSGTRAVLLASLRKQAESATRERIAAEQARESADQARISAERAREAAEQARASTEAQVRAEERTAIARDMHDSVSHHLSTIAMHAGAMSFREDLPPEQLRHIAGTVRDAAQQANGELRQVLVALRSKDGSSPLAAAPTLQDIVDTAVSRGQDVTLTWQETSPTELDRRGRSTVVALSRILGEMVANAAKHAPQSPLALTLARREQRLVLTARNPLAATGGPHAAGGGDETGGADRADGAGANGPLMSALSTGHGLIGLQERARLLGGDARSGADGAHFEVEAWIPW